MMITGKPHMQQPSNRPAPAPIARPIQFSSSHFTGEVSAAAAVGVVAAGVVVTETAMQSMVDVGSELILISLHDPLSGMLTVVVTVLFTVTVGHWLGVGPIPTVVVISMRLQFNGTDELLYPLVTFDPLVPEGEMQPRR